MRMPIAVAAAAVLFGFQIAFAAEPAGNLRVCASKGMVWSAVGGSIKLPPNLMLEEGEVFSGDVRDPEIEPDNRRLAPTPSATVILVNSATLTRNKPCATLQARTMISNEWRVFGATVRASDHKLLQATHVVDSNGSFVDLPGKLGNAISLGVNAEAMRDIGEPLFVVQDHRTDTWSFIPLPPGEIAALPAEARERRTSTSIDYGLAQRLRTAETLEDAQAILGTKGHLVEVNPGRPGRRRVYQWQGDDGSATVTVEDNKPMTTSVRTAKNEDIDLDTSGRFQCKRNPFMNPRPNACGD